MAARFDLSDQSVVVIVGSGAGGGALGRELSRAASKLSASKQADACNWGT